MSHPGPRPFSTRRLDALPLDPSYADEMAVVLADPALYVFTGGEPPEPAALRARYERQCAGPPEPGEVWSNWVLRVRAEGRLAGYVQATVREGRVEIAWVVGAAWQGRGYAKEAVAGLATHLIAPVGDGDSEGGDTEGGDTGDDDAEGGRPGEVRTLVAHIHPEHAASCAVAASAGLAPTGEWEDGERRWQRDGPGA